MLSPYLRFGDLSPRYVDWRVCQAGQSTTRVVVEPLGAVEDFLCKLWVAKITI